LDIPVGEEIREASRFMGLIPGNSKVAFLGAAVGSGFKGLIRGNAKAGSPMRKPGRILADRVTRICRRPADGHVGVAVFACGVKRSRGCPAFAGMTR
jgi:hypothetical protein